MEFNELIASFAMRHNVADLVVKDGTTALDIDGIVVNIVSEEDMLIFTSDIGEPPAEGIAVFANLLLEANLQSEAFFAKLPDAETYIVVRRLLLSSLDDVAFDVALEAFVHQTETWRRLLVDFRPAAQSSDERVEAESLSLPSFGSNRFLQV